MIPEQLLMSEAGAQWKKIGAKHHHGICLPLFSLHTYASCGLGEYLDLLPLIDYCADVGFDVIQLLPLNDTGLEKSPYSALSAFALNPLHLSLTKLPAVEEVPNYKKKLRALQKLTQTPRVDYAKIRPLRERFLEEWFQVVYSTVHQMPSYHDFIEENHEWLLPFSLFKVLKEEQKWRSWEKWPDPFRSPTKAHYETLLVEKQRKIAFHMALQYFCFAQFAAVKERAEEQNVLIKGDIPILINRDSADVWHRRRLFFLDVQAGAPPDYYTKDGQNWGFPIYNWVQMQKKDFIFWKERLRLASKLYHLYRIDHVVGFFRLWCIPLGHPAIAGSFRPEKRYNWIPHGKKLMQMMLKAAPILPIGEDLGLVPDSVKKCLNTLGIPGTKMMRWEKKYRSYIDPKLYPAESMTTVSTHDSDTLQLWWKYYPREAKAYAAYKHWPYHPFLSLDHHLSILQDAHYSGSLFHINLLQEYLALFPHLVSENPLDERINIPGKILPTNWTYRYRHSLEELLKQHELRAVLRQLSRL